jgi:phage baseplate assembly protein W
MSDFVLARDIFFDSDFLASRDGDWTVVEGTEAMRQALYHRLITSPGEFKMRPDYGVGVLDFVKEASMVEQLKTRIRTNLLQDRRIQDVAVSVQQLENALRLNVIVTTKGQRMTFRPFDFARDAG